MPLLKSVVFGEILSARVSVHCSAIGMVKIWFRPSESIFNNFRQSIQSSTTTSNGLAAPGGSENFETCCVLTYFRSGLL